MALMDFIKKQFIDIIQWTEEGDGTLAWRFPMAEMEIQNGASLTVRESQMAVFVNEGKVADVFGPGTYKLTTQTLPVLTYLKNWDKLFESPFKSDVYFFSTRQQIDQKWGTPQPISLRDSELGFARVRGFGQYTMQVSDPKRFVDQIVGTQGLYQTAQIEDYLRNSIISRMPATPAAFARLAEFCGEADRDAFLAAIRARLDAAVRDRVVVSQDGPAGGAAGRPGGRPVRRRPRDRSGRPRHPLDPLTAPAGRAAAHRADPGRPPGHHLHLRRRDGPSRLGGRPAAPGPRRGHRISRPVRCSVITATASSTRPQDSNLSNSKRSIPCSRSRWRVTSGSVLSSASWHLNGATPSPRTENGTSRNMTTR